MNRIKIRQGLVMLLLSNFSFWMQAQNVGIGTSAPASRLHVTGGTSGINPNGSAMATFENSGSTYLNVLSGGETGLLFGANGNAADGGVIYNNPGLPNGLLFRTNNNINRLSISSEGKVGINHTAAQYTVDIVQPAGANFFSNTPIVNVAYTGTNLQDVIGLKSKCKPADYYGIGGSFEGGYIGVDSKVEGNASNNYYGTRSISSGSGTGNHYGINGTANATSGTNYGVFGHAISGTTNWAGYFNGGNVYINNRLSIGVTNPMHTVDIEDDQAVANIISTNPTVGSVLVLGSNAAFPNFIGAINFNDNGNTGSQILFNNNSVLEIRTNGTDRMNFTQDGNVGINRIPATNKLEVSGAASKTMAGEWVGNSDARLKKNIHRLDPQQIITKLLALEGITYEWNDDKTGDIRPEGVQYGFTAQNIQEVFPSLVEEDAKGYLQTAYGTYDAMMIESIRYLNEENKMLKEEIALIKELLQAVRSE